MRDLPIPKKKKSSLQTIAMKRAPEQEKDLAKKVKGKPVKGSGSGWEKGDVRVKDVMRVECKCTQHNSFSVTKEMIDKIEDAACNSGEVPVIHIEFVDAEGNIEKTVCVAPEWVLKDLVEG